MKRFSFIQMIKTVIRITYYFFLQIRFLLFIATYDGFMFFYYSGYQSLQKLFLEAYFQPAGYPRNHLNPKGCKNVDKHLHSGLSYLKDY